MMEESSPETRLSEGKRGILLVLEPHKKLFSVEIEWSLIYWALA
jgi:hypothetical protein